MAKNSAIKGAKKSRRMGRPRTPAAIARCAARKKARIEAQEVAHARNIERGCSEWDLARVRRNAKRH